MSLKDLDRGDKTEIHVRLYERELAILDAICEKYNCSRAAIIGYWTDEYARSDEPDLTGKVRSGEPGAPSRRR